MKKASVLLYCLLFLAIVACEKTSSVKQPAKPAKQAEQQKNIELYAFKDFKLGMSLQDFNKLGTIITYKHNDKDKAIRKFNTTIGGAPGRAMLIFEEYGQGFRLHLIGITISKDDFYKAKGALISKYGTPETFHSSKSNAMGATFECETLFWNNGVSGIRADSIGEKINESDIIFHYFNKELLKKMIEKGAKNKKDI